MPFVKACYAALGSWCVCVSCSVMSDSVISWTVAHQTSPSVELSRQEDWSGSHSLLQGNLPNPGMEPESLSLLADPLSSKPPASW